MIKVIKRDGRIKDFDNTRVVNAVKKAFDDVYKDNDNTYISNKIGLEVLKEVNTIKEDTISIEKIQDIVVNKIKDEDESVANAYEAYREKRSVNRESFQYINREMDAILDKTSEELTNNANKDGSKIQSLRAMFADIMCKNHARRRFIPKDLQNKHEKTIYYHDENYISMPIYNCCLINWEDMFNNNFMIGTTKIETPKSFETAIALLAQIVSHVASNCYGGVTLPKMVKGLVPYAKKSLDKYLDIADIYATKEKREEFAYHMLERELKNGAQSFEYEIQTLTTARAEVPFVTEELDIGDFSDEQSIKLSRMITKAFLNQRLKGLTGGVTPVFPKIVYQTLRGVNLNPEDKNYDLFQLAIKCSAYRGYPDYINTERCVEVTGDYKPPMGKRILSPCKTLLTVA